MYLELDAHGTFNSLMDNLDTVISLLQPGVEEISSKCGAQPAKRVTSLLNKISFLQRDAMKTNGLIYEISQPN